jgi:hypothetical protein
MSQINGTAADEKTSWLMRLAQSHPRDLVSLLSSTQALDYDLLARFEDKWDWIGVSCNTACPWSIELIERFKDRFHWEGIFRWRTDWKCKPSLVRGSYRDLQGRLGLASHRMSVRARRPFDVRDGIRRLCDR